MSTLYEKPPDLRRSEGLDKKYDSDQPAESVGEGRTDTEGRVRAERELLICAGGRVVCIGDITGGGQAKME